MRLMMGDMCKECTIKWTQGFCIEIVKFFKNDEKTIYQCVHEKRLK